MPKVISHTPAWLSRPSPGFDMFTKPTEAENRALQAKEQSSKKNVPYEGARRIIARRGTEVFVVVGNTIRWADLPMIKDDWEAVDTSEKASGEGRALTKSIETASLDDLNYRVCIFCQQWQCSTNCLQTLKTNVHEQIHQLIPSPNEQYLAIITAHTVHIAILPDSIHLGQPDSGPIRVKTHTLGPTIHVLSQSRIINALWHPLGVAGECLVTVTADAVVRLWELNKENRGSYDNPTIDLDLTKLLHATSAEDSVAPVRIGESKGFSMDSLGMEVASAKFGGTGFEGEQGWSSMTLWIAMTEGEIYALCPLLPTRWKSPSTQVPSLTTEVVAKKAFAEGPDSHEQAQRSFEAQYKWLSELDEQNPMLVEESDDFGSSSVVYRRPQSVGAYPSLQGPFRILPGDLEDDLTLADIHVVSPKLRAEELIGGEDDDSFEEADSYGLSATVISLVSTTGQVYICLNLEEVEGQWLPLKRPRTQLAQDPDSLPELVLLEVLDTLRAEDVSENEYPVFTPDIHSRYSLFVTHSKGVYYLSVDPWINPLENELQSAELAGAKFRMGTVGKGSQTLRQRLVYFTEPTQSSSWSSASASLMFQDSDLGYFLLTSFEGRPQGVLLESPLAASVMETDLESYADFEEEQKQIFAPPRQPYEPPPILWEHKSSLRSILDHHVNRRNRGVATEEIRLSSATLEVMTEAHRVLSHDTNTLGYAVADLFTRCNLLQQELRNQLVTVHDIANRVARVTGNDADDFDDVDQARGSNKLEERLNNAKQRQEDLVKRHDMLRKKLSQVNARPLSNKEKDWFKEVDDTARTVGSEDSTENEHSKLKTLSQRWIEVGSGQTHAWQSNTDNVLTGQGTRGET
jgi:nucleoporin NUP82